MSAMALRLLTKAVAFILLSTSVAIRPSVANAVESSGRGTDSDRTQGLSICELIFPERPSHMDETPWILWAGGIAVVLIAGSAKDCGAGQSAAGCPQEVGARAGAVTSWGSLGSGITADLEAYFHPTIHLRIGIEGSLTEFLGSPTVIVREEVYNPSSRTFEIVERDSTLNTDTFVLNAGLKLSVGDRLYFGGGTGLFLATSDRKYDDALGSGWRTFGSGVSYQIFLGARTAPTGRKARFVAEAKLTRMVATSDHIDSRFRGTDFGGVSCSVGVVF